MDKVSEKVSGWTTRDVGKWLQQNGFSSHVSLFKAHKIDGKVLLELTESDLRNPPLQLPLLGDIKHLTTCLDRLHSKSKGKCHIDTYQTDSCHNQTAFSIPTEGNHTSIHKYGRLDSTESCNSNDTLDKFPPELWKTVISFVYCFVVCLFTSFVMAIAHDRVPDKRQYPPLPDIVLDNVPFMPWAFDLAESCACIMVTIWGVIIFFHKHRLILLRRMCSLAGTIFLLRCCTMLMTSLSVPGEHLECDPKSFSTMELKVKKALEIFLGGGMSLKGVRTCGDYMFSGHTCVLTLLNFFITEYSPRRLTILHTTTWLMNMFGIFFILAAHEHYSIDVFVAFYITSRLFLYYHALANNHSLKSQDRRRMRTWFPMFAFFESRCLGVLPNEYDWPFSWPQFCGNIFSRIFAEKKYQ